MTTSKRNINPIFIGIVGAVVGAVGSAAAIALAESKKRKQLTKKVDELKKQGAQVMKDSNVVNEIDEGIKAVKKATKKAAQGGDKK